METDFAPCLRYSPSVETIDPGEILRFRIDGAFEHAYEIVGQLGPEIMSKAFDHLRTPPLGYLPREDVLPDRPIKEDELSAHCERSTQAGLLDATLEV